MSAGGARGDRKHLMRRVVIVGLALAMLAGCASQNPRAAARVLSPFGAVTTADGSPRAYGPHIGVDLAAPPGTPVIAAADGVVWSIGNDGPCGIVIVLLHEGFGPEELATRYCHLSSIRVQYQQRVRRGDVIAASGTTGQRPASGFESLHFELRREWEAVDPMPFLDGCFNRNRTYGNGRLVLTYPLAC